MKFTSTVGLLTAITAPVLAQTTDSSLTKHTIYAPTGNAGNGSGAPVFIWGNGGCGGDGTSAQNMLKYIAAAGYLVVSQGSPKGNAGTTVDEMKAAVTWAAAGGKGAFAGKANGKQIMTAGWSCGGTEAMAFYNDPRVATVGIFSSGLLSNYDQAKEVKKPFMFLLGGPSDIAYPNGERDYKNIPASNPTWKANLNRVGHGGTYQEPNGGLFGKAAVQWLNWVFKGEASGKTYLTSGAKTDFNDVTSKSLDSLKVPISA